MRIVVVGAGLAGLTTARALAGTHQVVVVDKGHGVGGRMATRRIGDATLDHGAQFFTTHTDEFAAVVAGWLAAEVAQPWFRGRVGPAGIVDPDGHTRFRGIASMNVGPSTWPPVSTCEPPPRSTPSPARTARRGGHSGSAIARCTLTPWC